MSPALAGRYLTTVPPGKSQQVSFNLCTSFLFLVLLSVMGSSIQYIIEAERKSVYLLADIKGTASDVSPSTVMLKAGYQIPQVTRLRKVPPSPHLLREFLKKKI